MKRLIALTLAAMLLLSACASRTAEPVEEEPSHPEISEPVSLPEESIGPSALESEPEASGPEESEPEESSQEASEPEESEPEPVVPRSISELTYRYRPVVALYSLDAANRSYLPVQDAELASAVLLQLEAVGDSLPDVSGSDILGFLVVTEDERFAYYLAPDDSGANPLAELVLLAQRCNTSAAGRNIQWLAFMDAEGIENVSFDGMGGAGYTRTDADRAWSVKVDTSNAAQIAQVAALLKSLNVQAAPSVYSGTDMNPAATADLFTLNLAFRSGVFYYIYGFSDTLTIRATGMSETITYRCSKSEIDALRDLMSGLEGARLSYVD